MSGSSTVSPVAADAAEALRDRGMEVTIDDSGGSAGGLAQLGQGQVDIATSAAHRPPPPPTGDRYAVVGGNEEQVTKLSTTPGSVGPLSTAFVAGHPELVALAIDGVQATPENIADGSYPMARPLYLVTDGPATGDAARFVDYVLSADGQALVTDHGYLRQDELGLA